MTNLIPERRLDRNNRAVTRWVRPAPRMGSFVQIPAPSAQVSPKPYAQHSIDVLYNFAYNGESGTLQDIYGMEMPLEYDTYAATKQGLASLPPKALHSLSHAMEKAASPSSKEIVANLIYRLGDCEPHDKKKFALLALHAETIVELMDTKCQHVYEAEPIHLLNNVAASAIKKPMSDVDIEVQTEAALTLGIMFPCEYFHDDHRIVSDMIRDRDRILNNHELVINGADHIRGRNTIDVDILMDMKTHFGALRKGTL